MEDSAYKLIHKTTTLSWIVSPILLEVCYDYQITVPFYIALIPAFLLFIIMLLTNYLPGGDLAGKVSLADTMEHEAKLGLMNHDNEYETEFLGANSVGGNSKADKRVPPRMVRRSSVDDNDPSSNSIVFYSSPVQITPQSNYTLGEDNMEI